MSLTAARGIVKLARFDAEGLAAFDATPRGLVAALTPWLAIALVIGLLLAIEGDPLRAIFGLLLLVVAMLAPPVASHALARVWHREDRWLRYAVAAAWCQWIMAPVLLLGIFAAFVLIALGMAQDQAELVVNLLLLGYVVSFHVFLARRALALSFWRGVGLVLAVDLATTAAVLVPALVAMLWEPAA